MRVAVLGGTGSIGVHVTRTLAARGHEVTVVARSALEPWHRRYVPAAVYRTADVAGGQGLAAALEGQQALVDVTDGKSPKAQESTLIQGSKNVLAAAAQAGVEHATLLSIVGIDKSGWAYYQAKLRQEEHYLAADLPTCIQRTTQFHSFVDYLHSTLRPVRLCPYLANAMFQTVEPQAVGLRMAECVERALAGRAPDAAGPELKSSRDYAEDYVRAAPHTLRKLPLALPGKAGAIFRQGVNIPADSDEIGGTYAEWLTTARPR